MCAVFRHFDQVGITVSLVNQNSAELGEVM
jgi:hypothetical protein